MEAGLGKRLMFGSDQMEWPEAIGLGVEAVEAADFLSADQKRDIFYNNAARFLRLLAGIGSIGKTVRVAGIIIPRITVGKIAEKRESFDEQETPMASQTNSAPRAVVTGASSGIGLAFAERLAHDGYALTISARNRERLSALKGRLERECGVTVEVCIADLATPEGQAAVVDTIANADDLEFLINNAGFLPPASFLDTPADALEAMVAVHITATVKLTRAALPGMVARGRGVPKSI